MNPELPNQESEPSPAERIAQLEAENKRLLEEIEQLKELATKDPLTSLFNRRGFEEEFKRLRELESRAGRPISVAICDIDDFKTLNDTYGHDTGDKVLKLVADTITKTLRASDAVGRWGGEEFVIILPGATEEKAAIAAGHIRAAIEETALVIGEASLKVTISIGVAEDQGFDNLEKFIDYADKGLYEAKRQGKNRVVKASEI